MTDRRRTANFIPMLPKPVSLLTAVAILIPTLTDAQQNKRPAESYPVHPDSKQQEGVWAPWTTVRILWEVDGALAMEISLRA